MKSEPPLYVSAVMRAWELDEAKKRKADPKFENAQERAERAIMLGHDYDGHSKQKP